MELLNEVPTQPPPSASMPGADNKAEGATMHGGVGHSLPEAEGADTADVVGVAQRGADTTTPSASTHDADEAEGAGGHRR